MDTKCSYCGGAGGTTENTEHNVRCPRFGGSETGTAGLNAMRDGTANPGPRPRRNARQEWVDEDRRIRERLAAERRG